ncbi:MAG: hypothetical protein PHW53_02325 [Patescibacteria group bacterium]|nr:hypothetical protein [Patescibacteria group bacterium]
MKNTIFSPFVQTPSEDTRALFDNSLQLEELRGKDSDSDGLSDFDELYVHNTSPYLPDTDSDGMSDSAEITAGKDPNCPEGQECYIDQTGGTSTAAGETEEVNLTESEKADLMLQLPADEIRELLKNAGVPEETLNQLTDDELKQMVADVLAEEGGSLPATGSTSTQE